MMKSNIVFSAVCAVIIGLIALSASGAKSQCTVEESGVYSSSSSDYFFVSRYNVHNTKSEGYSKKDYFVAGNTAILLSTDISHLADTVFKVKVDGTSTGINNAFMNISGKNLCENERFSKAAGSVVCSKPVILIYDPFCTPCDARIFSKDDSIPNNGNVLSVSYDGLSSNAMLSFVSKNGQNKPSVVLNKKLMKEYKFFPDPSLKQE
jgi:hypothetical protein